MVLYLIHLSISMNAQEKLVSKNSQFVDSLNRTIRLEDLDKKRFYLLYVIDSISKQSIDSIMLIQGLSKGIMDILLIEDQYQENAVRIFNKYVKKATALSLYFDCKSQFKKLIPKSGIPAFVILDNNFQVLKICRNTLEVYNDFATKYLQYDNLIDKAKNTYPCKNF